MSCIQYGFARFSAVLTIWWWLLFAFNIFVPWCFYNHVFLCNVQLYIPCYEFVSWIPPLSAISCSRNSLFNLDIINCSSYSSNEVRKKFDKIKFCKSNNKINFQTQMLDHFTDWMWLLKTKSTSVPFSKLCYAFHVLLFRGSLQILL